MRKYIRKGSFLVLALLMLGIMQIFTVKAANIQEAPVWDGETYLGREYNADFDQMFDNFERSALGSAEEANLWWAYSLDTDVDLTDRISYLEAKYSTTVGTTKDAPIYKVASQSNTTGSYELLVLEMRGKDGASIEDLYLSFRYLDNYEDIDIDFTNLLDPEYAALPELTSEYQTYIIDLAGTLSGKTFNLKSGEGAPTVEAGKALAGFHFMSKTTGDGAGTIDIKSVYWSNDATTIGYTDSTDNFLLDDFNRTDLHDPGDDTWWRGGGPGSQIIGKWLAFDYTSQKAEFKEAGYDPSNALGNYDNVVFRIKGAVGGEDILISPFYVVNEVQTIGDPIALSTLKGPDGQVGPAITTEFQNIVINFDENEIDKTVNGFKLESKDGESGLIYIDQIFFTNMEYDASTIATEYPLLDPTDFLVFDNFNRDSLGATSDYDPNNQVALDNGLLFIIGYAGMDRMSIDDGNLVFDCTQNGEYIQYTSAGSRINDGSYQYMVLKVKGEDGASMNYFRIKTIHDGDQRSTDVWGNGGLKSGTGLPIPDFDTPDYPYVTDDGYMYVIIDLEASNLSSTVEGFDLYYSDAGKLSIDTIFFANDGEPIIDQENKVVFDDFNRTILDDLETSGHYWFDLGEEASIIDNALVLESTVDDPHTWYRTAAPANNKTNLKEYLVFKMKTDSETTDLSSFRISTVSEDSGPSFYNQGSLVSFPGVPIPEVTTEYQTFVVDLEASGLDPACEGLTFDFGFGDAAGKIYIDEIYFADRVSHVDLVTDALQTWDDENPNNGVTTTTTEQTTTTTEQTTTTTEDTTTTTEQTTTTEDETPEDDGLGSGMIALIIAGGVLVVGGVSLVIFRKRN